MKTFNREHSRAAGLWQRHSRCLLSLAVLFLPAFSQPAFAFDKPCGKTPDGILPWICCFLDFDGDVAPDCLDACPSDPEKVTAGVCGCGTSDKDSDKDGRPDCIDPCPGIVSCCGSKDSDGDGHSDCDELCPHDPHKTSPGICGCGVSDADSDGDQKPDCLDACPDDAGKLEPGLCGCGVPDADSDGDGKLDCRDHCPDDANKTTPGICGCGIPDTDSDADGVLDCLDVCDGSSDADSDGDGTVDCLDVCPEDGQKTAAGVCGCGVPDIDTDGDGAADCVDECISDPFKIVPGVCGCGHAEKDCLDCEGVAFGGKKTDECGVCGGDGSSCKCAEVSIKKARKEARNKIRTLRNRTSRFFRSAQDCSGNNYT